MAGTSERQLEGGLWRELLRTGVYKRSQGRVSRQLTFAALAGTLAVAVWRLSQFLPVWLATPGGQSPDIGVVRFLVPGLLLAAGTPMLGMGDEVCRSQQGNNNAYCQDGPISWFDWSLVERHQDLKRFVQQLIAFRQRRDFVLDRQEFTLEEELLRHQVSWHGVEPGQPDWGPDSRSFAVTVTSTAQRFRWHLMANAWWEPLRFDLPPADAGDRTWRQWIDTAQESPAEILAWGEGHPVERGHCQLAPRSIQVVVVDLPA